MDFEIYSWRAFISTFHHIKRIQGVSFLKNKIKTIPGCVFLLDNAVILFIHTHYSSQSLLLCTKHNQYIRLLTPKEMSTIVFLIDQRN